MESSILLKAAFLYVLSVSAEAMEKEDNQNNTKLDKLHQLELYKRKADEKPFEEKSLKHHKSLGFNNEEACFPFMNLPLELQQAIMFYLPLYSLCNFTSFVSKYFRNLSFENSKLMLKNAFAAKFRLLPFNANELMQDLEKLLINKSFRGSYLVFHKLAIPYLYADITEKEIKKLEQLIQKIDSSTKLDQKFTADLMFAYIYTLDKFDVISFPNEFSKPEINKAVEFLYDIHEQEQDTDLKIFKQYHLTCCIGDLNQNSSAETSEKTIHIFNSLNAYKLKKDKYIKSLNSLIHEKSVDFWNSLFAESYSVLYQSIADHIELPDSLKKDWIKLIEKVAIEKNNINAQYTLGVYYKNNESIACNNQEALKYLDLAANQGHANAQYSLGIYYMNINTVPQDVIKSFEWHQKAADQGYAAAQNSLALCYENGTGIKQNFNEAFKWYTQSANQGDAAAQYNLAVSYEEGIGVAKDLNEAFKWYTQSANQGDTAAQNALGFCYGHGIGVAKDLNEAFKWYTQSASQGYATAQNALGFCYWNGLGVTQDFNEAFKWLALAADQGHVKAQYNLAVCYQMNKGTAKDTNEALRLLILAADQGYAEAQYNLGLFYEIGKDVNQDDKEAFKWYQKAAIQGHTKAQYNLNLYYENGIGIVQDINKNH